MLMDTVTLVFEYGWNSVRETPWTVLVLVAYVINYFCRAVRKPQIRCGRRRFARFLSYSCPAVNERLWVTPFCYDGRFHTVMTYYSRSIIPSIQYTRRELLQLSDGGYVSLDWLETKESYDTAKQPTILFLPGLNGHSQICYIKTLVLLTQRMGFRSIVYNFRGKGGIKLSTQKTFCPLDYNDLTEVIRHLKGQLPESPLLAVGTSLGGILLGHYVSNLGEETGLEAAILISSVFDLKDGFRNVEQLPLNIHFSRYLCHDLITVLKQYEDLYRHGNVNLDHVLKSQTLSEFVGHYTVPLFGFKNIDEYYHMGYLNDKLKKCRIPLLAINAEDDPFQPGSSLPDNADLEGAPVAIVVTKRGGHLGFQDGFNVFKPSWADRLFCQFCTSILQNNNDWKHSASHG